MNHNTSARMMYVAPSITSPSDQFVAKNQRWAVKGAGPEKAGNVRATDPGDLDGDYLFPVVEIGP
jgi:hypothetical protein